MPGTVETLYIQLEGRINQFEKAMAKATGVSARSTRKIESDFARAQKSVSGFGRGLIGGAVGAAGGTLLAGLSLDSIRKTVSEAAKIGDMADRVGVTTGVMQELAFAIDQAGGSSEAAGPGLQKFAQNLADAKTGSGDLYKVLRANGVEFRDAAGNLLPLETVLGRYADLVKNAASPQEALELAVRAFGRASGPELVGLLSLGEEGMRSLMSQATKMSDDTVRKAQEIDDKFAALANTLGSYLKSGAITAAGAFSTLSTEISNADVALDQWERDRRIANGEDPRALAAQQMKFLARPTLGDKEANDFVSGVKGTSPLRVTVTKPTVIPGSGTPKRDRAEDMLASLRFEQEQLSRTAREQEVFNNLRAAGADLSTREGQQIAEHTRTLYDMAEAQRNAADASRELQDMAEGALSGFAHDLMNGVSAAEAFQNSLRDIASQLIDMAIKNLVANAFGGASGGGGGFFSGIGKLFGFASGTANTGGARGQVRGVVHGQEAVIPLPNGGRVPVEVRAPVAASAGTSGPARVEIAVVSGEMFDARVQSVSGNVAATIVKQNNKGSAGRQVDAQKRYG